VFCILGLKLVVQAKSLRTPGFRFHKGMDLTLLTSSKQEKEISKKPFPKEENPTY